MVMDFDAMRGQHKSKVVVKTKEETDVPKKEEKNKGDGSNREKTPEENAVNINMHGVAKVKEKGCFGCFKGKPSDSLGKETKKENKKENLEPRLPIDQRVR